MITPRLKTPWSWLKENTIIVEIMRRNNSPRIALKENPGIDNFPDALGPGGINTGGPVIVLCDPLKKGWRGSRRRVHSSSVAAPTLHNLLRLVVAIFTNQVDVTEHILLSVLGKAVGAVFSKVGLSLSHLFDPLYLVPLHLLASEILKKNFIKTCSALKTT